MSDSLTILFEDNHCLAVSKPAGLLTQGVPESLPTLESLAKQYLKEKYHKPGRVYLGIPHRLDRPVSGVVLFAKQTKSAQRLAEQFQKRQVQKIYWAAVEGEVEPEQGQWQDWLRKVPEEARAEIVEADSDGAKHAVMHYKRLCPCRGGCLLEIQLETGRMHQIRLQTSSRGYPIQGDSPYGATSLFGPQQELPRDQPIALHARSLTFLHPIRYEAVTVTAPLPDTWKSLNLQQKDVTFHLEP